jgi:hypothetical protein
MKILFSPSETKQTGGENPFDLSTLFLNQLYPYRNRLLYQYHDIIKSRSKTSLSKLFGIKKDKDINNYLLDIQHSVSLKAIKRYTGVAFNYLDYSTLSSSEQLYIDRNVIIFSNLFGPILASDLIPFYKLKQGMDINGYKPEKIYQEHSSLILDSFLHTEEILDLRAGFYDKFYKPSQKYTTLKFIKNGKVISHWVKAYRGIILRKLAKENIKSIQDLIKLPLQNLEIVEIQIKKNKTEIIYKIFE